MATKKEIDLMLEFSNSGMGNHPIIFGQDKIIEFLRKARETDPNIKKLERQLKKANDRIKYLEGKEYYESIKETILKTL